MRLGSMLSHMYAPVVAQRLRSVLVLALAGLPLLVAATILPMFATQPAVHMAKEIQ